MTTLTTKILTVTAKTPAHDCSESDKFYNFKAFEYSNGVCSVSYSHTPDGFFLDSGNIEACGLDEIISVKETGESFEMSFEAFSECLAESVNEFGESAATDKALELL